MNSSEQNGAFFLSQNPATLLLEDGTLFKGYALGAIGTTTGELCFNTSMVGYQEILTDPSYNRQIILMTYPQIGNYGINSKDIEEVNNIIKYEPTINQIDNYDFESNNKNNNLKFNYINSKFENKKSSNKEYESTNNYNIEIAK